MVFISARVNPAFRPVVINSSGLMISSGPWLSLFKMSFAPDFSAPSATWGFVPECPLRLVISKKTFFFLANLISASLIRPGCAKMSISASSAARLVPSITGSTRVSPCATMILIPSHLAYFANGLNCSKGKCVSSTPAKTLIGKFFGQWRTKAKVCLMIVSILL